MIRKVCSKTKSIEVGQNITKTRKERKKKHPQKKSAIKIINQKRTYPPVKPSEYYFNLLEFATKHFKAGDDHA